MNGDHYTRSMIGDMDRALRNDWPVPAHRKDEILERCFDLISPPDVEHEDGTVTPAPVKPRTQLAAMRTIATLAGLSLAQQRLDLDKLIAAARIKLIERGFGGATDDLDARAALLSEAEMIVAAARQKGLASERG